jgi:hypothetical protein
LFTGDRSSHCIGDADGCSVRIYWANWRCLAVENLSNVELLDGPWQTAENHSRPQNCIDEVELDVDDSHQPVSPTKSPDPKSAKL